MRRASDRTAIWATIAIALGSMVLIFARLGHYALWDDEALTAMTAKNVWRTGDTSAWADDHNLLAYRNGLLIDHFKDRYTPPLQFYLLAPVVGIFGDSNLVCRLPFAIMGMITVAFMLRWLWRARPGRLVWWAAVGLILTNYSFFLFQRQCRYYSLATTLTVMAAYIYCHWDSRRRWVVALSLVLITLVSSQYLNYVALAGCLGVDYLIWGRKRRWLDWRDMAILLVPQLVVGFLVFSTWNPVARAAATVAMPHPALDGSMPVPLDVPSFAAPTWGENFLKLFWWNWRDMLACDFVVLPLLALCPLLYLVRRNVWLLRAPAALVVYMTVMTAATVRSLSEAGNAEVRYLSAALPLCIGIGILAVWGLADLKPVTKFVALAIAVLSLVVQPGTNGVHAILSPTAGHYYRELVVPQEEPYTPVAKWINAHLPAGATVLVRPAWMAYPLMFRAPKVVYAWQLADPAKAEYAHLPDIHFEGRVAPDYLIGFGPFTAQTKVAESMVAAKGARYEQIDTIHVYYHDLYRPERIWRAFRTPRIRTGDEVYVYRRVGI